MPRPRYQNVSLSRLELNLARAEALQDPLPGISAERHQTSRRGRGRHSHASERRSPPPSGRSRFGIPFEGVFSSAALPPGSPSSRPIPARLAARGPSVPPAPATRSGGDTPTRGKAHTHFNLASPVFALTRVPAVPLPSLRLTSPASSCPLPLLSLTSICCLYGRHPDKDVTSLVGYTVMFQSLLSETGHI